jgi:hypothetical protein
MDEIIGLSGSYRVEISGWDLNEEFFVEKTDLVWTRGGEKKLLSRHALPNGAIIFVRLATPGVSCNSVPVVYRVDNVQPMNSAGECEMRLLQLNPRGKESCTGDPASDKEEEDSAGNREPKEKSKQREHEEILHDT